MIQGLKSFATRIILIGVIQSIVIFASANEYWFFDSQNRDGVGETWIDYSDTAGYPCWRYPSNYPTYAYPLYPTTQPGYTIQVYDDNLDNRWSVKVVYEMSPVTTQFTNYYPDQFTEFPVNIPLQCSSGTYHQIWLRVAPPVLLYHWSIYYTWGVGIFLGLVTAYIFYKIIC